MLDNLKQMQEQGIFKILPSDENIDDLIYNAKSIKDIEAYLEIIQVYIKELDTTLKINYNVPVSNFLSDFYDKFNYELFDIVFNKEAIENGRYTKTLDFGTAGTGVLCMKDILEYKAVEEKEDNVRFKLEERKLLKLINHYYIKLKSTKDFDDDMFYIPFEHIKQLFITDNNKILKDNFINICNRLKHKLLYWDLSDTHYKKLKQKDLSYGKEESLVDITILYQPRKHKKGIKGEVYTIKGLICKVNKFMKMRYELKQIYNKFPIEFMKLKHTEYVLAERITYHLNLINANNERLMKALSKKNLRKVTKDSMQKKIRDYYESKLVDLSKEIHSCQKGLPSTTYFHKIATKDNSARTIKELISAITNVLVILKRKLNFDSAFIVRGKGVKCMNVYLTKKKVEKLSTNEIYNSIANAINSDVQRGKVKYLFQNGDIKIRILINVK